MRLAIVVAAALALMGCKSPFGTDYISVKKVEFAENSINLHPMPVKVEEVEGEAGEGTEFVFPDGSYLTLTGGGAAGNLMLVVNQNDGTTQDVKTDAKAEVTADVPVVFDIVGEH